MPFLLLVLLTFSVFSFQHSYNDIIRCHYLCIYSVWDLDRVGFFSSLWFDGFCQFLGSILAISLYIFLLYSCCLLLLDLSLQGLSALPFSSICLLVSFVFSAHLYHRVLWWVFSSSLPFRLPNISFDISILCFNGL